MCYNPLSSKEINDFLNELESETCDKNNKSFSEKELNDFFDSLTFNNNLSMNKLKLTDNNKNITIDSLNTCDIMNNQFALDSA